VEGDEKEDEDIDEEGREKEEEQEELTDEEKEEGIPEQQYSCSSCPKSFVRLSSLHTHQKIHQAAKDFPCGKCPKSFSRRNDLSIHERVHTGERPYGCALCEKSFRQRGALQKHERSRHGTPSPHRKNGSAAGLHPVGVGASYRCEVCGKCCNRLDTLKNHAKIHSGVRPHQVSL
jgi:uncharacterized Zn-finger protein